MKNIPRRGLTFQVFETNIPVLEEAPSQRTINSYQILLWGLWQELSQIFPKKRNGVDLKIAGIVLAVMCSIFLAEGHLREVPPAIFDALRTWEHGGL